MERETLIHTIEPVFDGNSRVLLLGTFPSPKSREMGFYYGHPQNRMWRVLSAVVGEEQVSQSVDERKAFLLRHGIAMWDVLASCSIEGAADASIQDAQPNDLGAIFQAAPIAQVFTTGAKATELYNRFQLPTHAGHTCMRLPSTSAANAAWSLERLIDAYSCIKQHL